MEQETPKEHLAKEALDASKLVKDTAERVATAMNIAQIQKDITEIKESIRGWSEDKEKFVLKEEFVYWRNLLVSGILLTIAVGAIVSLLKL
jgi:type IV secretory pathway component VirB8